MKKLWLEEGYCPKDNYQCLMPVEYESIEEGGVIRSYRKLQIACRHVRGEGCEYKEKCPFYETAPEQLEKNVNWYEE